MKKLFLSTGLLFFGCVLFISYRLFWPPDPKGSGLILDVPAGKTFYSLAEDMEEKKLIAANGI